MSAAQRCHQINMDVYLFIYDVKPTSHSLAYGQAEGAHANIYVLDTSVDTARIRAQALLIDYGWIILDTLNERLVAPGDVAGLWEDARKTYHTAISQGIGALFICYGRKGQESGTKQLLPLPSDLHTRH